jgi:hypothetical protein
VHKRIISAVKKAGFVNDRMLYIILRGTWCDRMLYIILRGTWCDIVPVIHAQIEDKMDDVKDSFYNELGCVFNK